MPSPDITENYIRIRVKNPSLFVEGSFRTLKVDESRGIKAIIGKLKSDPNGSTVTQSFLFDKERWDVEDAQKWVDEHNKAADVFLGNNEIINLSEDAEEKKMSKICKMYSCELKDFNEDDRSFTAIASTGVVDRDGDILEPAGVILKNYKKNNVLLWGHDASSLPIGKGMDVKVERLSNGKEVISFRPKFASAEDGNPFAEQVFRMYKSGFLKAFSIRFDPFEYEDMPDENRRGYSRGRRYTKFELLEISAVNVPANPEALKVKDYQNFIVKSAMYDHGIKEDENLEKEVYNCECIECGHKIKTKEHCKDLTCAKCGGQMRRVERPGPGQAGYESFSEKEQKLQELREKVEEIRHLKETETLEEKIDAEIKTLEDEIEMYHLEQKYIQSTKEIQDGITDLEARRR